MTFQSDSPQTDMRSLKLENLTRKSAVDRSQMAIYTDLILRSILIASIEKWDGCGGRGHGTRDHHWSRQQTWSA